jgi:hypothetical protein
MTFESFVLLFQFLEDGGGRWRRCVRRRILHPNVIASWDNCLAALVVVCR